MAENKGSAKLKNTALNVVYSVLLFVALFCIGIAIVDPSALSHTDNKPQPGAGAFLIFGLSIALTIVFSMWFIKRSKRQ